MPDLTLVKEVKVVHKLTYIYTMRILVTGGAGFIGSHLVDALLKEGHYVAVIDNLSKGKKAHVHERAHFYHEDILSPHFAALVKQEAPEIIFHIAGHISVTRSVQDPAHDAHQNIVGSLNVLKAAQEAKVQKFIFASSGGAIYGQATVFPTPEEYLFQSPYSSCLAPYCISKFTVENYLVYYQRKHNLPFVSLRFANVYGPRQDASGEGGVIAIFVNQLLAGETPTVHGDGTQIRDFIYVNDVVEACRKVLHNPCGQFFNIGTGTETTVNALYEKITTLLNVHIAPRYSNDREGEVTKSVLDSSKIHKELGWTSTTSLDEGLIKTIAWFRAHTR